MILKFKPTKDRVLIDPLQGQTQNVGGICIPERCRDDAPTEGIVAAIGPKVTEVKVGDRLLFPRHDGDQIKIGGRLFKLFRQSELLAVVE